MVGNNTTPPIQTSHQRRMKLSLLKNSAIMDADELSLFRWYVIETEILHEKMYSEELQLVDKQDIESASYNDSGLVAVRYFTKRSRYSHIIYLASLGEKYLSDSCRKLSTALGDNVIFGLDEIKGNGWIKERKFMQRYGNFEIPNDLWERFSTIYFVRNALVHENGEVTAFNDHERAELRNKCARAQGVSVEGSELEIKPEFVESCVNALQEFMVFLDGKLGGVIERSIKPRSVT